MLSSAIKLLTACCISLLCAGNNLHSPALPSSKYDTDVAHHVFKERVSNIVVRNDITKGNRKQHDDAHTVIFVIQQKNMDSLTKVLEDVSDPLSQNYGQHWTREEVTAYTANPVGRDAVVSYLHNNNVKVIAESLGGEYITAEAKISVWENMFKTEFYDYHHTH